MNAAKHIVLTIAAASVVFAQTPPAPEFEVASIRPSADPVQGQVNVGIHYDGAQVRIAFLTLKDYLAIAYRLRISQIIGPAWTNSDRFDIAATLPPGTKQAQVPDMLQTLLADRFGLKIHREKREFPVYALVAGKGPLKLKEIPPDPDTANVEPASHTADGSIAGVSVNLGNGSSWSFVPNRFEAKKLSMEKFSEDLGRFTDRPIVDRTDIKGQYDFAFDIQPEDYQPMMIRVALAAGANLPSQALKLLEGSSAASLSDALQHIGLRLDARKEPLDVIVVDDGNKTPTQN